MARRYVQKKRTYVSFYEMKCEFCDSCETCNLPACSMDGYDPTRKQRRFNAPSFSWTPERAEKYHRLEPLKLSIPVLANIFDCTVGTMIRIVQNGGKA